MKALIQRVKAASVTIDGELYSSIEKGVLVFLGVESGDTIEQARWLAAKIAALRIFEDEDGKMNLSIKDVKGEALVVSQFTLCGDCKKGTRPSFDKAEKPEAAAMVYEGFVELLANESGMLVKTGVFQAMMDVMLVNDGPVTFMLEK